MAKRTLTITLTASEVSTIQTALDWYYEDRLDNAKHTLDDDDSASHRREARYAAKLNDKFNALLGGPRHERGA